MSIRPLPSREVGTPERSAHTVPSVSRWKRAEENSHRRNDPPRSTPHQEQGGLRRPCPLGTRLPPCSQMSGRMSWSGGARLLPLLAGALDGRRRAACLLKLLHVPHGLLEVLVHRGRKRRACLREAAVLELGLRHCGVMRDLAGVAENLPLREPQEIIELRDPVGHVHGPAVHRLQFGEFEVGVDDAVERLELLGDAASASCSARS